MENMDELLIESEKRTNFFREAGPDIAEKIGIALSNLAGHKIAVLFIAVQTYKEISAVIDVNEKCFGSYVTISNVEKGLKGTAFLFFPLHFTSYLIEIILKQHFTADNNIPAKLKLSTFKEINSILLMRYVNELANALGIQLNTSAPAFTSFKSMKFTKQPEPEWVDTKTTSLITVMQLDISSQSEGSSQKKIRGHFVVIF